MPGPSNDTSSPSLPYDAAKGRTDHSAVAPGTEPARPVQDRADRCSKEPALRTLCLLLLLALALSGCSILNRFVIIPKKELGATPEKYGYAYQEVWFESKPEVELNGWLVPGAPDRPLVVLFHGNAGNMSDNLEYLKLLHRSGYSVFLFDYRGFGKSDSETFYENDMYQDARGALNFLRRRGWQGKDMIYFGQSLGAAVALQMALESKPRGLVLEGAFTSMNDIARHVAPVAYYTLCWWAMNLPFNNLDKIARVDMPVLLIHGDRDTVVPIEMTRRLFARANAPKRLHIISGGGHCDVFTLDYHAYLAAWDDYLQSIPQRTVRP